MSADAYIIGADYGTSRAALVAMLVDNSGRVIRLITADEFYLESDSTAIVQDSDRVIERRYLTTHIINDPRELKLSVKDRLPPAPWIEHEVRAWHRRRACQMYVNWHTAALPRGRVRRWRSLKEKRQAWGFA